MVSTDANSAIPPDSLIFDMDGTLWDNVNSFEYVWNKGLEIQGYTERVTRQKLLGLMGLEPRYFLNRVIPQASEQEQDLLFDEVIRQYQLLVPRMTPKIYDGVLEGIEKLSRRYRLFLLSNCEEGGLVNFMNHTRMRRFFEDYMEHGQNLQRKAFNMQLLKERNHLKNPVYIGDTDSDSREAAAAGIPFVFVTYGFGKTNNYWMSFDSFTQLTHYFLNL